MAGATAVVVARTIRQLKEKRLEFSHVVFEPAPRTAVGISAPVKRV
jgi:hypothetical protein